MMAHPDDETGHVKVTVQPKVMPDDAEEFKRRLQLPQLDNPHIIVEVTLSAESIAVRPVKATEASGAHTARTQA